MIAVACPANAANKCTDPSGKVTYQDRPCAAAAAAGAKIDIRPNSVDGTPNPEVVKRLADYEKKIDDRQRSEDAQRAALAKRTAAHKRQCQSYIDDAERQYAWLQSISVAARASAAAEINIARRKYSDAQCANPNYSP